MEHYVNIMLDGGFKAVFGDKQVAMDFINAALECTGAFVGNNTKVSDLISRLRTETIADDTDLGEKYLS